VIICPALTTGQRDQPGSRTGRFLNKQRLGSCGVLTQYEPHPGLAVEGVSGGSEERSLCWWPIRAAGQTCSTSTSADALFALMPRTFWVELQTPTATVLRARTTAKTAPR